MTILPQCFRVGFFFFFFSNIFFFFSNILYITSFNLCIKVSNDILNVDQFISEISYRKN